MAFSGCEALQLTQDYSKLADVKTGEPPVYTYLKDRLLDFWDIFGFRVHFGQGLLGNIRATKIAQAGIGYCEGKKLGFKGRQLGYWDEYRHELGVSVIYIGRYKKSPLICNTYMFDAEKRAAQQKYTDLDLYRNDDRHWTSCGISFFAGFIGMDFDICLYELFDFLFGIVTVDIADDDTVNQLRMKQTEMQSSSAATETFAR
jgi:hypothetical protein